MRTYQHIIDTKAIKITLNSIPDYWVVRDLTERDYGIDLMVEIFTESGKNKQEHPYYDATGRVCYLQVKGTDTELSINQDNTISFNMEKNALLYVEKFSTPFILTRVCTIEKGDAVYYCWLQRYILEVLDNEKPDWRESKQNNFTIRIPIANYLPKKSDKIERIAARIKYIEEAVEFREKYNIIEPALKRMIEDDFDKKLFKEFTNKLKRIKNLTTLFELNNCQVTKDDIQSLIDFVEDVKNLKKQPKSIDDFPQPLMYNLELLFNELSFRIALEIVLAENDNETNY